MPEETVPKADYDALKARVDDLASKVFSSTAPAYTAQEKAPKGNPYWMVTERVTGGTYTVGVDWEPQFYDGTATYRLYGIATVFGELPCLHPANSKAAMCVLEFDASYARDVNAFIGG